MSNTLCKNCYFSDTAASEKPCSFDIPELINKIYNIDIIDKHYRINNYSCKYGFSKKIFYENIDKLNGLNMLEYVKSCNIIKYSIALILQDTSTDLDIVIKKLYSLSIKPDYVTIICSKKYGKIIHSKLETVQKNNEIYIKYKIHDFIDDEIDNKKKLHIALQTNKNNIGNFLWILTDRGLSICEKNDSIQNINYMFNLEQKPAHYYKSSAIDSQFDGIFINSHNYYILSTKTYEIENNENTIVEYYD